MPDALTPTLGCFVEYVDRDEALHALDGRCGLRVVASIEDHLGTALLGMAGTLDKGHGPDDDYRIDGAYLEVPPLPQRCEQWSGGLRLVDDCGHRLLVLWWA